jgi:hypothetical protein
MEKQKQEQIQIVETEFGIAVDELRPFTRNVPVIRSEDGNVELMFGYCSTEPCFGSFTGFPGRWNPDKKEFEFGFGFANGVLFQGKVRWTVTNGEMILCDEYVLITPITLTRHTTIKVGPIPIDRKGRIDLGFEIDPEFDSESICGNFFGEPGSAYAFGPEIGLEIGPEIGAEIEHKHKHRYKREYGREHACGNVIMNGIANFEYAFKNGVIQECEFGM